MDDLAVFLLDRLAEDDEVAQTTRRNEQFVQGTDRWFASHGDAITSMAPHRAVAEVKAKRELINWVLRWPLRPAPPSSVDGVLERLALPYANHPDYRPEWKP